MKLRTRILWLCAAALCGALALIGLSLHGLRQTMLEERTAQVDNMVVLALAAVEKLHEQEKAGKLTREAAQAQAVAVLSSLRKEERYYFVRGYTNDINYVHPNPKRIGIVDPKGGKEAGERYRAALQGKAIGNVVAPGTRPGLQEKVDKLYAVVHFQPWDWIIGTGDYIDDIDTAFWRAAGLMLGVGGVLVAVVGAMGWTMSRSYTHRPAGYCSSAGRCRASNVHCPCCQQPHTVTGRPTLAISRVCRSCVGACTGRASPCPSTAHRHSPSPCSCTGPTDHSCGHNSGHDSCDAACADSASSSRSNCGCRTPTVAWPCWSCNWMR